MDGPCLCGDPYCPRCGNPRAMQWADAEAERDEWAAKADRLRKSCMRVVRHIGFVAGQASEFEPKSGQWRRWAQRVNELALLGKRLSDAEFEARNNADAYTAALQAMDATDRIEAEMLDESEW